MAKQSRYPACDTLTLKADGPIDNHGLQRGAAGKSGGCWQVYLTRQRRIITRTFYDRTYGGYAAAEKVARAYRDAIVAEIPQTPKELVIRQHRETKTGITGVTPVHRKGVLVGYNATFTSRSGTKQRTFSLKQYSDSEARLRANAQRETWVAEAILEFVATNRMDESADNPLYSEQLLASPHWQDDQAAWLEDKIAAINGRFDALRPLWLTLRVAIYPGERLVANISDGGHPAEKRRAQILFGKRGLEKALPELRDKIADVVRELFGRAVADRFLKRHGDKFDPKDFDPAEGIAIRELPEG